MRHDSRYAISACANAGELLKRRVARTIYDEVVLMENLMGRNIRRELKYPFNSNK